MVQGDGQRVDDDIVEGSDEFGIRCAGPDQRIFYSKDAGTGKITFPGDEFDASGKDKDHKENHFSRRFSKDIRSDNRWLAQRRAKGCRLVRETVHGAGPRGHVSRLDRLVSTTETSLQPDDVREGIRPLGRQISGVGGGDVRIPSQEDPVLRQRGHRETGHEVLHQSDVESEREGQRSHDKSTGTGETLSVDTDGVLQGGDGPSRGGDESTNIFGIRGADSTDGRRSGRSGGLQLGRRLSRIFARPSASKNSAEKEVSSTGGDERSVEKETEICRERRRDGPRRDGNTSPVDDGRRRKEEGKGTDELRKETRETETVEKRDGKIATEKSRDQYDREKGLVEFVYVPQPSDGPRLYTKRQFKERKVSDDEDLGFSESLEHQKSESAVAKKPAFQCGPEVSRPSSIAVGERVGSQKLQRISDARSERLLRSLEEEVQQSGGGDDTEYRPKTETLPEDDGTAGQPVPGRGELDKRDGNDTSRSRGHHLRGLGQSTGGVGKKGGGKSARIPDGTVGLSKEIGYSAGFHAVDRRGDTKDEDSAVHGGVGERQCKTGTNGDRQCKGDKRPPTRRPEVDGTPGGIGSILDGGRGGREKDDVEEGQQTGSAFTVVQEGGVGQKGKESVVTIDTGAAPTQKLGSEERAREIAGGPDFVSLANAIIESSLPAATRSLFANEGHVSGHRQQIERDTRTSDILVGQGRRRDEKTTQDDAAGHGSERGGDRHGDDTRHAEGRDVHAEDGQSDRCDARKENEIPSDDVPSIQRSVTVCSTLPKGTDSDRRGRTGQQQRQQEGLGGLAGQEKDSAETERTPETSHPDAGTGSGDAQLESDTVGRGRRGGRVCANVGRSGRKRRLGSPVRIGGDDDSGGIKFPESKRLNTLEAAVCSVTNKKSPRGLKEANSALKKKKATKLNMFFEPQQQTNIEIPVLKDPDGADLCQALFLGKATRHLFVNDKLLNRALRTDGYEEIKTGFFMTNAYWRDVTLLTWQKVLCGILFDMYKLNDFMDPFDASMSLPDPDNRQNVSMACPHTVVLWNLLSGDERYSTVMADEGIPADEEEEKFVFKPSWSARVLENSLNEPSFMVLSPEEHISVQYTGIVGANISPALTELGVAPGETYSPKFATWPELHYKVAVNDVERYFEGEFEDYSGGERMTNALTGLAMNLEDAIHMGHIAMFFHDGSLDSFFPATSNRRDLNKKVEEVEMTAMHRFKTSFPKLYACCSELLDKKGDLNRWPIEVEYLLSHVGAKLGIPIPYPAVVKFKYFYFDKEKGAVYSPIKLEKNIYCHMNVDEYLPLLPTPVMVALQNRFVDRECNRLPQFCFMHSVRTSAMLAEIEYVMAVFSTDAKMFASSAYRNTVPVHSMHSIRQSDSFWNKLKNKKMPMPLVYKDPEYKNRINVYFGNTSIHLDNDEGAIFMYEIFTSHAELIQRRLVATFNDMKRCTGIVKMDLSSHDSQLKWARKLGSIVSVMLMIARNVSLEPTKWPKYVVECVRLLAQSMIRGPELFGESSHKTALDCHVELVPEDFDLFAPDCPEERRHDTRNFEPEESDDDDYSDFSRFRLYGCKWAYNIFLSVATLMVTGHTYLIHKLEFGLLASYPKYKEWEWLVPFGHLQEFNTVRCLSQHFVDALEKTTCTETRFRETTNGKQYSYRYLSADTLSYVYSFLRTLNPPSPTFFDTSYKHGLGWMTGGIGCGSNMRFLEEAGEDCGKLKTKCDTYRDLVLSSESVETPDSIRRLKDCEDELMFYNATDCPEHVFPSKNSFAGSKIFLMLCDTQFRSRDFPAACIPIDSSSRQGGPLIPITTPDIKENDLCLSSEIERKCHSRKSADFRALQSYSMDVNGWKRRCNRKNYRTPYSEFYKDIEEETVVPSEHQTLQDIKKREDLSLLDMKYKYICGIQDADLPDPGQTLLTDHFTPSPKKRPRDNDDSADQSPHKRHRIPLENITELLKGSAIRVIDDLELLKGSAVRVVDDYVEILSPNTLKSREKACKRTYVMEQNLDYAPNLEHAIQMGQITEDGDLASDDEEEEVAAVIEQEKKAADKKAAEAVSKEDMKLAEEFLVAMERQNRETAATGIHRY